MLRATVTTGTSQRVVPRRLEVRAAAPAVGRPLWSSRRPPTASSDDSTRAATTPTARARSVGASWPTGPCTDPVTRAKNAAAAAATSIASRTPSRTPVRRGGTLRMRSATGSRLTRRTERTARATMRSQAATSADHGGHRDLERRVRREHRGAGDGGQADGEQGAQRGSDDDRRQGLGEQQPARAAGATTPEPGDRHLTAALVGGRDEDQPEDAYQQERHLGHQQGHRDRGLARCPPAPRRRWRAARCAP